MFKNWKLKVILFFIFIVLCLGTYFLFMNENKTINEQMIFGVSFNPEYAREMNLDAQKVFNTIVDEWGFRYVRFSAQWNLIENNKGEYDFSELDFYMNEAVKKDLKIILAVGRKTPRWPECHLPTWAQTQDYQEYKVSLLNYIKTVVNRYKNNSALEIWQIENEPFLNFGLCSPLPKEDFKSEIKLVKEIDNNHKVMATDSGELSLWRKTATASDLFGTTMYRTVWNKWTGYWNYDWLPAWWYNFRLKMNNRDFQESFVVELQAEPWMSGGSVSSTPLTEQFKSMNLERLEKNIAYAKQTGLARSYLWGAEWWYFLSEQDTKVGGEFIEYIKKLEKSR